MSEGYALLGLYLLGVLRERRHLQVRPMAQTWIDVQMVNESPRYRAFMSRLLPVTASLGWPVIALLGLCQRPPANSTYPLIAEGDG